MGKSGRKPVAGGGSAATRPPRPGPRRPSSKAKRCEWLIDRLGSLHIVVHGLALDGNSEGPVGGYDTLFEAVLPVACGGISGN
jgi:hypothetical protein